MKYIGKYGLVYSHLNVIGAKTNFQAMTFVNAVTILNNQYLKNTIIMPSKIHFF
jgi:hypothetical protein